MGKFLIGLFFLFLCRPAIFAFWEVDFFCVTASSGFILLDDAAFNIENIIAGYSFRKTAIGMPVATAIGEIAGIYIKSHFRSILSDYPLHWNGHPIAINIQRFYRKPAPGLRDGLLRRGGAPPKQDKNLQYENSSDDFQNILKPRSTVSRGQLCQQG